MLTSIVILQRDWDALMSHLAGHADERMAFAYCSAVRTAGETQYLVRAVDPPGDDEYRFQGTAGVSLKAEHAVPRARRAREHAAFVDLHSHPFTTRPSPSSIDDRGAQQQARQLATIAPGTHLIRIVTGRPGSNTLWAEVTDPPHLRWTAIDRVIILGRHRRLTVRTVNSNLRTNSASDARHARTAAVIGDPAAVREARVAIIGAGGTGSAVAAQIRGYVRHITIIDPDRVEGHNAPRLYHYVEGDEGALKAEIHVREIRRAFPDVDVNAITAPFPDDATIEAVKASDIVFCCPDHNAVRYSAARVGMQFLKPVIEIGCGGRASKEGLRALGYHVRFQTPGGLCLACNGLDLGRLEDPSTSEMKRRIGYIEGEGEIQGELMPLTTRAAADAVDLFFRYFSGYAGSAVPSHLYFDALHWRMINVDGGYESHPDCTLCGDASGELRGTGDVLPEALRIAPSVPFDQGEGRKGEDRAAVQ